MKNSLGANEEDGKFAGGGVSYLFQLFGGLIRTIMYLNVYSVSRRRRYLGEEKGHRLGSGTWKMREGGATGPSVSSPPRVAPGAPVSLGSAVCCEQRQTARAQQEMVCLSLIHSTNVYGVSTTRQALGETVGK